MSTNVTITVNNGWAGMATVEVYYTNAVGGGLQKVSSGPFYAPPGKTSTTVVIPSSADDQKRYTVVAHWGDPAQGGTQFFNRSYPFTDTAVTVSLGQTSTAAYVVVSVLFIALFLLLVGAVVYGVYGSAPPAKANAFESSSPAANAYENLV